MNEFSDSGGPSGNRFFPRIKHFVDEYAKGSGDDQRAAQVFVDCESSESISGLKSELLAVSQGKYTLQSLDQTVGKGRIAKYGSYDRWASLTLRWIAEYKR